jgi:8-oxo-dGTP diphosphatase
VARQEDRPRLLRLFARRRGGPGLIPDTARLDIALAVVLRGDDVLVAKRAADAHLPGSWEFPGGKVEDGEEPDQAALRELKEETGLIATSAEPLLVFVHDYPDRRLRFHAFLVRDASGDVRIDSGRDWAWVAAASLESLAMPDANRSILRALRWRVR